MNDDNSPLMRSLKTAFYERAYVYAEQLQGEVDSGRMSSEVATAKLVEIMNAPDQMAAVVAASAQFQVAH